MNGTGKEPLSFKKIGKSIKNVSEKAKDFGENMVEKMKDFGENMVERLKDFGETLIEKVKEVAKPVVKKKIVLIGITAEEIARRKRRQERDAARRIWIDKYVLILNNYYDYSTKMDYFKLSLDKIKIFYIDNHNYMNTIWANIKPYTRTYLIDKYRRFIQIKNLILNDINIRQISIPFTQAENDIVDNEQESFRKTHTEESTNEWRIRWEEDNQRYNDVNNGKIRTSTQNVFDLSGSEISYPSSLLPVIPESDYSLKNFEDVKHQIYSIL